MLRVQGSGFGAGVECSGCIIWSLGLRLQAQYLHRVACRWKTALPQHRSDPPPPQSHSLATSHPLRRSSGDATTHLEPDRTPRSQSPTRPGRKPTPPMMRIQGNSGQRACIPKQAKRPRPTVPRLKSRWRTPRGRSSTHRSTRQRGTAWTQRPSYRDLSGRTASCNPLGSRSTCWSVG